MRKDGEGLPIRFASREPDSNPEPGLPSNRDENDRVSNRDRDTGNMPSNRDENDRVSNRDRDTGDMPSNRDR